MYLTLLERARHISCYSFSASRVAPSLLDGHLKQAKLKVPKTKCIQFRNTLDNMNGLKFLGLSECWVKV